MKVFIFHHHLNPGGVTRIIYSQLEALQGKGYDVTVVTGAADGGEKVESFGAKLLVKEDLNYLANQRYEPVFLHNLLQNYIWFLKETVSTDDVLHVHNLNLGKNPVWTFALYLLAKEGYRVLNHAHDFPEDRPNNYDLLQRVVEKHFEEDLEEVLYPSFDNYRYAVLNSFDFDRLLSFGVAKSRIEWLPNPINLKFTAENKDKKLVRAKLVKTLGLDPEKLLVTYPVRVIERKNIGELILLYALFKDVAEFVVTQPPKNPQEVELYEQWLAFCERLDIKVQFAVGNVVDFEELLSASDFSITTSYMEGFGMAYLEPWLFDTPVIGRDIPYITKDFRNDGFQFAGLYSAIVIPTYAGGFKELTMAVKMRIIEKTLSDTAFAQAILDENPKLSQLFNAVGEDTIAVNKEIIVQKYSLIGYGNKLQNEYQKFFG